MYAGKRKYLLKDQNPSKPKKLRSEIKRENMSDWQSSIKYEERKYEERLLSNASTSPKLQHRQVLFKKVLH